MTWRLRSAATDDADAIAEVHRRSRERAMPWLPRLHTPEEDRAFFAAMLPTSTAWVAVDGEVIVGFALVREGWLDHLYVDAQAERRGVGTALLLEATLLVGAGLQLWVFQRNVHALEFYARRGFIEVDRTDGADNEEREPDVLMRWG